jgi:hypothetical protein
MRISALSSLATLIVLGVLAGPVHAERHKTSAVARSVADPAARTERPGASLTTGAIAITGSVGVAAVAAATHRELPAAGTRDLGAAPRRPRKQAHLSASDVAALVAPHAPRIERCYLDAVGAVRRTAQLDVMFVIARQGKLLSVDIGAPTASPHAVHAMATCIRAAVDDLQFPERRNDTTAIIPYVFQRTEAPNAGPQLSCWDPKGC